jgi:hypothetical protein
MPFSFELGQLVKGKGSRGIMLQFIHSAVQFFEDFGVGDVCLKRGYGLQGGIVLA